MSQTTLKMKERACVKDIEHDHFLKLKWTLIDEIREQQKIHPTFWNFSKSICRDGQ